MALVVIKKKIGVRMEIKLLIVDVDGTLTDGKVYYGDNNLEVKAFNIRDGAALKPLKQIGINVVFLTGRTSEAVEHRAIDLNAIAIQGADDKVTALHGLLDDFDIRPEQCAYIGDDLIDYTAMKLCGFKACPANAVTEIKDICNYVSSYTGGNGAVRDICEYVLRKMGKYSELLKHYGVI